MRAPAHTHEVAAAQWEERRHLIDISAANVDLIFSACWRGTALENSANQPVNQSNNLFSLAAPPASVWNAEAEGVSRTTGTSVVAANP